MVSHTFGQAYPVGIFTSEQKGRKMFNDERNNHPPKAERLLRWPDVQARVGICRSHAHNLIKEDQFPAPIKLTGKRASAWAESEINAWIAERVRGR